jgi:hypothetical protein
MGPTGVAPVAKAPTTISQDGWFNRMVSGRLVRYRMDLYGTSEVAQGTVDMDPTGEV